MTETGATTRAAPSAISIWKRPGYLALVFVVRSVFAVLAALFVAGTARASGIVEFPEGDALLFGDGSLYLLEVLRLSGSHFYATATSTAAVLCLGFATSLLAVATLLVALSSEGRLRLAGVLSRAVALFPAFFLLGAVIVLAQSLLVLGASMIGAIVSSSSLGERSADLLALAIGLVLGLFALGLGSLLDVARASAARYDLSAKQALLFALDAARRSPTAVLVGWFPFALAGMLLVAAAALLAGFIDVGKQGSARVLLVGGVHQLTLAMLVILRGAWLAKALRLVSSHTPSRRFALLT